MDNDGGGYDSQNFCVLALYGENAASYSSKGTFASASFNVGGTSSYRHIHGTTGAALGSSKPTMASLGMYLGGCCYTSWTSLTCSFN